MCKKGTFGWAIDQIRVGAKITRASWNNSAFIYFVPANKYPADGNVLGVMKGKFENDLVPYGDYIAIFTQDKVVIPFSIGQDSVLATDWVLVV